jgi:hypothetical protein
MIIVIITLYLPVDNIFMSLIIYFITFEKYLQVYMTSIHFSYINRM